MVRRIGPQARVPEFIARREQAVNEHGDSILGLKFSFMQHFTLSGWASN